MLWLTINRADKGNAIPYYVRDALIEAFRNAHWDLDVRAVVLTAAGERHFCTGADLSVPQPQRGTRPDDAPDRVVGSAINMMRAGFQQLMTGDPGLREAGHRRAERHRGRRRLDARARRRPRHRGRQRQADPGVRAPRPHPRRRRRVPAPAPRRHAQGQGAHLLRRRPLGRRRGHARHRQQGRSRGRAARLRRRSGPSASRAARPRRSAGRRSCCTTRRSCRAATSSKKRRCSSRSTRSTVDSGEGVASFRERRAPEWKGW